MARNPPDILITTPESLYLILTSQAREMLSGVEAVIVDEIHAVAATKRGSHLALTLERLEAQAGRGRVQRIGLSATQNPLEEIGRFLVGPRREVTIVDAGARKQLDLRIEVPVESMTEPGGPGRPDARPAGAGRRAASRRAPRSGRRSTRSCCELVQRAQLDDRVRQQPPLGRARRAAPERARRQGAGRKGR